MPIVKCPTCKKRYDPGMDDELEMLKEMPGATLTEGRFVLLAVSGYGCQRTSQSPLPQHPGNAPRNDVSIAVGRWR